MTEWTTQDSVAASVQGWNLFDCDFEMQLQKEDQYDIFSSDAEAVDFVKAQSAAGDFLAKKAISHLIETNSNDVTLFSLKQND